MRTSKKPFDDSVRTLSICCPLAVTLIASGLLMMAPEARAGGWTIVSPPTLQTSDRYRAYYGLGPTDEEKAAYLAQWGGFFSGGGVGWSATTTESGGSYRSDGGTPDVVRNPLKADPNGTGSMPFSEFVTSERLGGYSESSGSHFNKPTLGGAGQIKIDNGKMRYKLVWHRNMIRSAQNESVPDPNDNPAAPCIYIHGLWKTDSSDVDKDGTMLWVWKERAPRSPW